MGNGRLEQEYRIEYKGEYAGTYSFYDGGEATLILSLSGNEELREALAALGYSKERYVQKKPRGFFFEMINEENRDKSRKRPIYTSGDLRLERIPRQTEDSFSVYRRMASEGAADYSPLAHEAPHCEGEKAVEDMTEWANWYSFDKFDDGTYQASLDEAWYGGYGHNEGGTIHVDIPEEWFELSYDEFLERVVTLSSAAHYGFTADMLKERKGLKEFFGF